MKTLLKSIKITLVFCVFFSVFYILVLWLFAQVAGPNRGNACPKRPVCFSLWQKMLAFLQIVPVS